MIQQEKPQLVGTMPVVWPTLLDLGRDECKRILRKLGEFFMCSLCAFLFRACILKASYLTNKSTPNSHEKFLTEDSVDVKSHGE